MSIQGTIGIGISPIEKRDKLPIHNDDDNDNCTDNEDWVKNDDDCEKNDEDPDKNDGESAIAAGGICELFATDCIIARHTWALVCRHHHHHHRHRHHINFIMIIITYLFFWKICRMVQGRLEGEKLMFIIIMKNPNPHHHGVNTAGVVQGGLGEKN